MDETNQNGAGQSNLAGLEANQDVPQMPPLPISGPMPEGLMSSSGLSPGLTPGVATIATPTPSHELQPLGQSSAKGLDAATWAGQSLVVAVVLGGVALVAYAIKRRQLAKGGVPAARGETRMERAAREMDREPDHETVNEDGRAEHAAPAAFGAAGASGGMGMGGGIGDALRDEIATLRAEIESTRDEAAQLRREVASLRTMMERGIERGSERGATLRHGRSPGTKYDQTFATDSGRGETSHTMDQPHAEPKPAMRESVEQRVLALAARGESAIAIAQRTGVPTGQVELMINLARASGRV